MSTELEADSLPSEPQWKPNHWGGSRDSSPPSPPVHLLLPWEGDPLSPAPAASMETSTWDQGDQMLSVLLRCSGQNSKVVPVIP